MEGDIEEVEPGFEEFKAAPEDNFEDIEVVGLPDVKMEQETIEEAQPKTAS